MGDSSLCKWFDDPEFGDADDLFSILESLEEVTSSSPAAVPPPSPTPAASAGGDEVAEEVGCSPRGRKRRKVAVVEEEGGIKMCHIAVERNRRKQMNEHLTVLRSLMPCFYVKRGDQASVIGGVVDYISELQQILQSLEAKKQRKAYSDVLSPRLSNIASSPRPLPSVHSPRKPPISPRLINIPYPRTPQPSSPYNRPNYRIQQPPPSPQPPPYLASPCSSSTSSINDTSNELVANSISPVAEVEVKFSGPNLVLKTRSQKIAGQAVKIISALEDLSFEILQLNINPLDQDMVLNSFTIKIGIECQLSAEELALQIQQTFC
ncbi:uncharacterized protein [Phyllobates terribilis]|uniref:uncharacterized protein n=1 Tax=Phyllobates terribilis TaxID=111132 RepID=UPI003CCB52BD